jgi:YcxB-like protein
LVFVASAVSIYASLATAIVGMIIDQPIVVALALLGGAGSCIYQRKLAAIPPAWNESPIRFTVTGEGVRIETATAQGDTQWSGIVGIVETSDHFFIMLDQMNAWFLPKRGFESDAAVVTMREFATEHPLP